MKNNIHKKAGLLYKNIYKEQAAINKPNLRGKKQKMKNIFYVVAVATLVLLGTNASTAQTVKEGTTVNLADTTAANAAGVRNAKAFLKRTGSTDKYGTEKHITLAVGDTVTVTEVVGVKSRSGKTETQWMVSVVSSKKTTEYIVAGENPTTAINDKATCLTTASGCGVNGTAKVSVKHGDGPDGAISDLE